jgi:hypothetical protein
MSTDMADESASIPQPRNLKGRAFELVASATATLDSIAPLANEPLAYHAVCSSK